MFYNRKERYFLRDQSIAAVLNAFVQPHQKKIVFLRAVEHHSSTLDLACACPPQGLYADYMGSSVTDQGSENTVSSKIQCVAH